MKFQSDCVFEIQLSPKEKKKKSTLIFGKLFPYYYMANLPGKLPAVVLSENTNKIQDFDLIEEKVKSAFLLHSASVHYFSVRISFTLHCQN